MEAPQPFGHWMPCIQLTDSSLNTRRLPPPRWQGSRNEMYQEPTVLVLAEKYGKTPAQILLRFLTQKGIAVIPRSTQRRIFVRISPCLISR